MRQANNNQTTNEFLVYTTFTESIEMDGQENFVLKHT